jgi:hypothetical protein
MSHTAKLRNITSHNVIVRSKAAKRRTGRDLTGHWDHIGKNDAPPGNDKIFNGAVDNATGSFVDQLARAGRRCRRNRAHGTSSRPPPRKRACSVPSSSRGT